MTADLPHAHGGPPLRGRLRDRPEDFQVTECTDIVPDGAGEHVWLWVRKRGANTDWVARQLARHAGVPPRAVSYAGLKDRHAVTEQWFSLHLPGRADPDWTGVGGDDFQVRKAQRHSRKLKRGALSGNAFTLVLRQVSGDRALAESRLEAAFRLGVPNYFGEQRFGREGGNLDKARALFAGRGERDRHRRGLYLSAARGFLFNQLLARRVADGTWARLLPGDVAMLEGSHSVFAVDAVDEILEQRLARGDIHPTGALWGRGEPMSRGTIQDRETALAEAHADLARGLEAAGLSQERRGLRLMARDAGWRWLGADDLELTFRLPAGAYATVLLREIMEEAGPDGED